MKNIRNALLGIFFALVFTATFVHATPAREDDANDVRADSRVISARAGRINFVSGDVKLRRADSLEWNALTADHELKSGDTVNTGHNGRVEILLNPGSYFRAGTGAEFTLAEADLDDLRVELARGSAVVEATGYRDTELSITVATPRTTVHIVRTGIYRVNALADGTAEVGVFDGRVLVNGTMVKGGKLARAGAAGVEVTKLDKKNRDELDLWSRDRGKELAKANEKLQRRALSTLFASNSFDRLFGPYYGNGFWFYNDRMRCYTFVPFSYGWSSPYGYGYGTGVIPYSYPARHWPGSGENPSSGWTPPSNGGGSSGGGTASGGGTSNGGGTVPVTPSMPRGGDVPDRAPTTPRSGGDSSPRMDRDPAIDRHPRRDNR